MHQIECLLCQIECIMQLHHYSSGHLCNTSMQRIEEIGRLLDPYRHVSLELMVSINLLVTRAYVRQNVRM